MSLVIIFLLVVLLACGFLIYPEVVEYRARKKKP